MTVYTQVCITPHHAGFGMWESGELQVSPENSWALRSDLLHVIGENFDEVLPIAEALEREDLLALGVENIEGRIYNGPDCLYVAVSENGEGEKEFGYFGIEETQVPENFFKS